jgi:flagellar hook-associated protein 2
MTTTTSTTSTPTPTPTPTPTAASLTASAAQSLLTSLNTGSGVDTASLVTSLVQAQFAAKTAAITAKNTTLAAQISGVSTLKSTISGFSTALSTLITGGTLTTQPNSSNTAVFTATAQSGAKLANLSSAITVSALASAQGARSTTAVASRATPVGSGSFTLTLGTATYDSTGASMKTFAAGAAAPVTIDITNGSLDDIAAAINAKRAGVTASVITDADGSAYLSMKGATGAAQAFTLTASSSSDDALAKLNVGIGAATTLTSVAQDATLTLDGVTVKRSSNSISDLVPGVTLALTGTSTAAVALTSTRPTLALIQAASDVTETFNQVLATVKGLTDAQTGDLKSDTAAQTLLRSLQTLTTKQLTTSTTPGAPTTLAQIGIGTNRDGTLTVNQATLTAALTKFPDEVEAMFASATSNTGGLSAQLAAITTAASNTTYGLGASTTRYTKAQADLTTEQDSISTQSDAMTTRLTQQFSTMNSKVAAYKSTQTFLENQIKAWNSSNN